MRAAPPRRAACECIASRGKCAHATDGDRRVYGVVDDPARPCTRIDGSDFMWRWCRCRLEPPPILTRLIIALRGGRHHAARSQWRCARASASPEVAGRALGRKSRALFKRGATPPSSGCCRRRRRRRACGSVSGSMYATGWLFIVLTLMGVVLKIVGIWPDARVLVDLNGTDPDACVPGRDGARSEVSMPHVLNPSRPAVYAARHPAERPLHPDRVCRSVRRRDLLVHPDLPVRCVGATNQPGPEHHHHCRELGRWR